MAAAKPTQQQYLQDLARKAGVTVEQAVNEAFGRPVPIERVTARQASMVITQLRRRLGTATPTPIEDATPKRSIRDRGGIQALLGAGSTVLTAARLRAIHEQGDPRPDDIDADSVWVLDRLVLASRLEREAARQRGAGVNRGGPIEMSTLVNHFGGWDRLAEAFGVTVPTAKAWGTHLPAARAYEAEVKTQGLVKAPR